MYLFIVLPAAWTHKCFEEVDGFLVRQPGDPHHLLQMIPAVRVPAGRRRHRRPWINSHKQQERE